MTVTLNGLEISRDVERQETTAYQLTTIGFVILKVAHIARKSSVCLQERNASSGSG